jgi:histidyl-tRNA synthetase
MPSTQPARGMRDFLPDDVRRRAYVIDVIAGVYERYGFEPLETPAVENIDTLMGKYGDEGDKLIFRILKRGETDGPAVADLALRYDLTVPLARVVAEYRGKLPRLFKRYQIQPVWRADRPQRGRFREFYQCDVDAVGSTSVLVEAELCAAASDALATLGFREFTLRLNHRQALSGLLEAAGVEPARHGEALVAIDKLDKVGRDGVAEELAQRGIGAGAARVLLAFFAEASASATAPDPSRNAHVLAQMAQLIGGNETGRRGLDELERIARYTGDTAAAGRVAVDPSLARGLSYYTGAIMEIAVPDLAGSLGGGGRYDNLVGMFLGEHVPACGFSLGLERIIVVMSERGMFPAAVGTRHAEVVVTLWNTERAADALALARDLRSAGLRVDAYPEAEKIGKQLKFAASRGVPFVTVCGDDEAARGEVSVKDLRSGEQQSVPRGDVAAFIRARL